MARPVSVNIPHSLGKDEARRRIEDGFSRMHQQMVGGFGAILAVNKRWEGDRLCFEGGGLGQKLTGRLDVLADSIALEIDLPEILAALADKIQAKLHSEGHKLLEKK